MKVAAFVNGGTSTSFQLEVSVKIGQITPAEVSVISFYDESISDVDPDVADLDMDFIALGASSRFDFSAYRKLRDIITGYDILHTHYNFVGSGGRLAALGTDTKIVNTEHTDHERLSHLQNAVNAPTYPVIDTMVFNSQSTRNSLRRYERPLLFNTECTVIHNGVDFDRIEAGQKQSDIPELPDGPKIVTAARLVEAKNLETLVRAMNPVLAAVPDAELIIIGDGPKREQLERLVDHLEITESVTFLGQLERERVYGTINRCDIFAVPSWAEGFCNAAVEAMGCKLPVVASDIAVLREVVGDGGQFANPESSAEFAVPIIQLLENPADRRSLGEVAHSRATSEFTIEKCAEQYYNIYRSLIAEDEN